MGQRSVLRPSPLIIKNEILRNKKNEEKSTKNTINEHPIWQDQKHNGIDLNVKWGKILKFEKMCEQKWQMLVINNERWDLRTGYWFKQFLSHILKAAVSVSRYNQSGRNGIWDHKYRQYFQGVFFFFLQRIVVCERNETDVNKSKGSAFYLPGSLTIFLAAVSWMMG